MCSSKPWEQVTVSLLPSIHVAMVTLNVISYDQLSVWSMPWSSTNPLLAIFVESANSRDDPHTHAHTCTDAIECKPRGEWLGIPGLLSRMDTKTKCGYCKVTKIQHKGASQLPRQIHADTHTHSQWLQTNRLMWYKWSFYHTVECAPIKGFS